MIDSLGQVMLYVDDLHETATFWVNAVGFTKLGESDGSAADEKGIPWAEVAPSPTSVTTLVLFERKAIAVLEPEINLGSPSLLFSTTNLEATWTEFRNRGIHVGSIVNQAGMKTFNFSDIEGNYFAIREGPPRKGGNHAENRFEHLV